MVNNKKNSSGGYALYLTENDRPFPPEYYSRLYEKYFSDYPSGGEDIIPFSEDESDFFEKDIKFYSDEEKYEYRNDILIRWMTEDKFCPYRIFYKDIEVTKGKIKFFLEDGGVLIVESKIIDRNICDENSSLNKYESFYGKRSILEHHCSLVRSDNNPFGWVNKVTSYHTPFIISECIHDGVTSFILRDYGFFEDDFETITFNDVTYDAAEVGGTFYFEYNDDITEEENLSD